MNRLKRSVNYLFKYFFLFLKTTFSKDGLFSKTGRMLIVGKFRRILICSIPGLAKSLQKKYQLSGGCQGCGVSCKLLFTCPALDLETNRCNTYEMRSSICKMFPITPADLREVELIRPKNTACGYTFAIDEEVTAHGKKPALSGGFKV